MDNYGIIIDLETGGLDPERCAVTEIGALAFREECGGLVEVEAVSYFVRPPEHLDISREAATIQGRTVEELLTRDALSEGVALFAFSRLFFSWINYNEPFRKQAHRVYAHNAGFDQAFLYAMIERNRHLVTFPMLSDRITPFSCTLRLFQQQQAVGLWPESETMVGGGGSLDKLCAMMGIERATPHDALSDCRSTLALLDRLQKRMKGL